ncbi:MAG: hypothetical protein CMN32_06855 [Saprospirales bacterium]|nr:hypothetical protein [Saprospirales bacterium]
MKSFKLFNLFFLVLVVALAAGCGTAQKAKTGKVKERPTEVIMDKLIKQQLDVQSLDAKARVAYTDEYGKVSFVTYLRMKKDSAIWMSFKKFSIEAVRVLIRPDSVFIIDRLNGEYAAEPLSYLQRRYSVPVGFDGLQALLLGNPIFFSKQTQSRLEDGKYVLEQHTDRITAEYFLDGLTMLLNQWNVLDAGSRSSIRATFDAYESFKNKKKFSYFRSFNLNHPDFGDSKVEITFTKVETDKPVKLPFSIPSRYDRIN